jgi:MoaA/NifB/PqqE/SkfB family radical SAM enzyme
VYGGSKSALAIIANTMRLELEPAGIEIVNIYPGTIDSSFEENALREESRPGLCPTDRCGYPKEQVAQQVFEAASGPSGEVWLERRGKWLSVAALLWPKYVDRRLAPLRDKVLQTKSRRKTRWRLLQVESAIACNLRCVMCPWTEIREKAANQGIMSQEVWDAIRPYLPEVSSVDFTGGGEPLLQPRLTEWMAEAKSAGCQTGILTNGLLLNRETAKRLIDAALDWVCVSMDGATADQYEKIRIGSSFQRVCDNLASIAELRTDRIPKTMINFVIMHMNVHHVEEIVRLAARLGVDQVNFKQCDVVRGERGKGLGLFHTQETKEVRRLRRDLSRARSLAAKLKIETTASSFTPTERAVCEQDPRNSMFVRYDGAVAPCISLAIGGPTTFLGRDVVMPTEHYGRIPDQDLLELWETERCRSYRTLFQARVKEYENAFARSLYRGSRLSHERIREAALKAMPEAPEGCRICPYLYDL